MQVGTTRWGLRPRSGSPLSAGHAPLIRPRTVPSDVRSWEDTAASSFPGHFLLLVPAPSPLGRRLTVSVGPRPPGGITEWCAGSLPRSGASLILNVLHCAGLLAPPRLHSKRGRGWNQHPPATPTPRSPPPPWPAASGPAPIASQQHLSAPVVCGLHAAWPAEGHAFIPTMFAEQQGRACLLIYRPANGRGRCGPARGVGATAGPLTRGQASGPGGRPRVWQAGGWARSQLGGGGHPVQRGHGMCFQAQGG